MGMFSELPAATPQQTHDEVYSFLFQIHRAFINCFGPIPGINLMVFDEYKAAVYVVNDYIR